MITWIIKKLRKTENYEFETKLTTRELLTTINYRCFQVIRGILLKPFISYKSLLFIGKGVVIRYKNKISLGRNCIIEDKVSINALSENGIRLGNNVTIGRGCIMVGSGVIRYKGVGINISDNVGMNANVYIGGQGGVTIGENVIIGPSVKILAENHIFEDKTIAIKDQGESRKGISIGANCWLGANSIILDGVNLGVGCVVAAGSVVTKSFSDNVVIGGIPAKILKQR